MKNQKEKLRNQSHSPLQQKGIKYLRINLPKETKELYTENYKTLMKEIKDDINRCLWVGRISIVKMSILPNTMDRLNVLPPKIKSVTVSTISPSICHEVMGLDAIILVF